MKGPLWKGRFSKPPSQALTELSRSLQFDIRLWPQDIACTRAHAGALCRAGLISPEDEARVVEALERAAGALEAGAFIFDPADEDIHSCLERYLMAELGDLGARIHAGRSRNDLVVTDLRLWLKVEIPAIAGAVHGLQSVLYRRAVRHQGDLAPGFTHLQRAQPVVLAHHLLAHAFALGRDFDRLVGAYRRADVCALGAAAFAGTSLPLDPVTTASELGFSGVFDNSADAVSTRDFALEFLSAVAILGVQLSRMGEELVLWTSQEFGFAVLDDAFSTGSSIMPQKKNPDVAELIRARSARLTAHLMHLLGVLKGLPLAYNRDLQEDKEPVFDAADCVLLALSALTGALDTIVFDTVRLAQAAEEGGAGATDLAEALVLKGVPFRHAHEAVGSLVARAAAQGKKLQELSEQELSSAHPLMEPSMLEHLTARISAGSRLSHGGTAPERVTEQLARLQGLLEQEQSWLRDTGPG